MTIALWALGIITGVYAAGAVTSMAVWAVKAGPLFFDLFGQFLHASLYWPADVLEALFGDN